MLATQAVDFLGEANPFINAEDVNLDPIFTKKISKNESENQIALKELKKVLKREKDSITALYGNTSDGLNKALNWEPVKVSGFDAILNQGTPSEIL